MWLIKVTTLKLEFFAPPNVPEYVILSHTWGKDEVTFQDFEDLQHAVTKKGFSKIERACELAGRYGVDHAWVDTCCIDKSSSAELSESINSMYLWYQKANVCFAYIEDWPSELTWADLSSIIPVEGTESYGLDELEAGENEFEYDFEESESEEHIPDGSVSDGLQSEELLYDEQRPECSGGGEARSEHAALEGTRSQECKVPPRGDIVKNTGLVQEMSENDLPHHSAPSPKFAQSDSLGSRSPPLRWFTRGWTLQELISPKKMEFFDGNWHSRGMKSDSSVIENLSRITGIAPGVLSDNSDDSLREICFGQRMSWAAYRETSRVEDIAYCLLGIFQINMPLLYGEGANAFFRLQEEILKSSTDLSILAWTQTRDDTRPYRGIFSRHPLEFQRLGQCRLYQSQFSVRGEIIMTNKGARIETSLFHPADDDGEVWPLVDIHFLSLGCCVYDDRPQGIFLKNMEDFHVRAQPDGLMRISHPMRAEARTIYLARDFDSVSNLDYQVNAEAGIEVKFKAPKPYTFTTVESWPFGYYDHLSNIFVVGRLPNFVGYLLIHVTHSTPTIIATHKTQPVARFMAIISKYEHSNVLVNILDEDQAEDFKNHMKSTCKLDPHTAYKDLAYRLVHVFQNVKPDVIVQDHITESLLRLEGEVVNRKRNISLDGKTFALKGVKISINLDSRCQQ